ncbi:hypothetical protein ACIRJS_40010 [Streptomyces sp. NPDC102340]|uniref:hypothetical protein n=1 Tax=unclassified Streptomyces TaxID=2593676 RepID=UPI00380AB53A
MDQHLDLSNETPSNRADVFASRESTGLEFRLAIGPAKFEVSTDEAQSTAPSAIGVTMLLLAAGGSVPAVLFALVGRAAHVSPTLIAVGAFVSFLLVFGTGTLLILRGGPDQPRDTPAPSSEQRPPSRPNALPRMRDNRSRRDHAPRPHRRGFPFSRSQFGSRS